MPFNSTAFLADREAIANGIEPVTAKGYVTTRATAMADRNAWFAGLNDEERAQLAKEAEYEQSKLYYQQ